MHLGRRSWNPEKLNALPLLKPVDVPKSIPGTFGDQMIIVNHCGISVRCFAFFTSKTWFRHPASQCDRRGVAVPGAQSCATPPDEDICRWDRMGGWKIHQSYPMIFIDDDSDDSDDSGGAGARKRISLTHRNLKSEVKPVKQHRELFLIQQPSSIRQDMRLDDEESIGNRSII